METLEILQSNNNSNGEEEEKEEEEKEEEEEVEEEKEEEVEEEEEQNNEKEDEKENKIQYIKKNKNEENEEKKEEEIETFSQQCDLLKMTSIPTFGKYSQDYTFLEQVLILKSESFPKNFPHIIRTKIENLKNNYPEIKPEYFHITLSTSTFLSPTSEKEVNFSYTLLNLISHPYIFYNCKLDKEHRSEIYCAAFTDDNEIDTIKETQANDRLLINPEFNLDDHRLKREVILHMSDDGYPSLSPNNCELLVNLNAQIINFYVVVCGTYGGKIVKCFVGNFMIIPNANNSILVGDLYNKMVKDKNKKNLIEEIIIFKNKFEDYFNYIFGYGINEINNNAKVLEHIKKCITKAFSIIFEFSINGDEDDENLKKIHDKELESMQEYYYNNALHFFNNLYIDSKNVDPNFGEKLLEVSLKKKFTEDLLIKYIQFNIKRINNIINNMEFFILKNNDDIEEIEEGGNEKYSEEILPNLKSLFCDILNVDEEKLEELKENIKEENRIINENPYIEILNNIINDIQNKEDFMMNFDELDEIIKKYLFYIVWVYKNRPMNVHNDFGRVSFMNKEIDGRYYCNDEDKIKCCQKLIENLKDHDNEVNIINIV